MSGAAPLTEEYEAHAVAEGTAGTGQEVQVCVAPWAGTLTGAYFTAEAAATGVASNNKSLTVRNRAADGTGNVVMASLPLAAGTNLVAFDEKAITLSGTPANVAFNQGDVITYQTTVGGTGMILPEGKVRLTLSRS